jgi:hydrophobic/amphiphilic exporter-1 (mainly G- bacteria), HAE1 family
VIVAWRNGSPVRLDEIAHVYDSVENDKIATWFNGTRSIVLAIYRQPDANTVAVVDGVLAKLPSLRAQIPPSVQIQVAMDRSTSIRQSVSDVEETLLIAIGLVILVIFLFLRSASATLIPALAVPISLCGTFAVMYMLDFSINNMTLLALTLSVGFVVDDAIVMLENIVRHIEHGMRPYEAALKGAREIGFTIISITFSLIAVFIPVLLMGGIVGRVFREFAVTIAVAIVVSGFVSLTLTPMLCARVLKAHDETRKPNIILRGFERMFESWLRAYEWALDRVLARKATMLVVTFATLAGTIALYIVVPKGFFPQEDTGFLSGVTEAATDTSFEAMTVRQKDLTDILSRDPAVEYINSTVGAGGPNVTANYGRLFIALKPRKEREPAAVVMARLRLKATQVPGMQAFFQSIQNLNIGGRPSKSQYQYTLQSGDTEALYRLAPEMRDSIAKVPGLLDVTTDLYIKNPQMTVDIDREKAAVYGVTVDQVRNQLYNAYGARQVGTIYMPSNDYQIILEAQPQFRVDPSDLSKLYVKTANNQTIPLDAVAKLVPTVGPLQINHQGQQPAVTISFNLAPNYSLGYAVDQITAIEQSSNLPATIATGFSGTAQVFQDSLRGQGVLILAAVFAAFVILGILYESFIHPITHHLRAAVGRHRRHPHADAVQHGTLGDRDDRHRDVGRHRQEERHHDGGLCARASPRRLERRARHSRSRPATVPPDHDDDVRGDFRHLADCDRRRRRCGAAPAARRRRGRRSLRVAVADAVHHPGDLYLSRPDRPPPEAPPRTAARRSRECRAAARRRGGVKWGGWPVVSQGHARMFSRSRS